MLAFESIHFFQQSVKFVSIIFVLDERKCCKEDPRALKSTSSGPSKNSMLSPLSFHQMPGPQRRKSLMHSRWACHVCGYHFIHSELNLLLVNCFSDEASDHISPSCFCRVVLTTWDSICTLTRMLWSILFACQFEVVNVKLLQELNIDWTKNHFPIENCRMDRKWVKIASKHFLFWNALWSIKHINTLDCMLHCEVM